MYTVKNEEVHYGKETILKLQQKQRDTAGFVLYDVHYSAVHLLLLQLSDGVLGFLQTLVGRVALLPHHRQLPLDHIVLLCFLSSRHLTLCSWKMGVSIILWSLNVTKVRMKDNTKET